MPLATSEEINTGVNFVSKAMKDLQQVPDGISKNPKVAQNIGEAYSKLQETLILLQNEGVLVDVPAV